LLGGADSPPLMTTCVQSQPPLQQPVQYRPITISGQSAGASIAIQHLVAFSSSVRGAMIAAGSPYGCGVQRMHGWSCYYGLGLLDIDASERYVRRRAQQRLIDDPSHLRTANVLLFSGRRDVSACFCGTSNAVSLGPTRRSRARGAAVSPSPSASRLPPFALTLCCGSRAAVHTYRSHSSWCFRR
jgi:hypothetical protein